MLADENSKRGLSLETPAELFDYFSKNGVDSTGLISKDAHRSDKEFNEELQQ